MTFDESREPCTSAKDTIADEHVQLLAFLSNEIPDAFASILDDILPEEQPVQDYITDVNERCDIFRAWQRIESQTDSLGPRLNATALAIALVAPLRELRAVTSLLLNPNGSDPRDNKWRVQGFLKDLCTDSAQGVRTYLGRRLHGSPGNIPGPSIPPSRHKHTRSPSSPLALAGRSSQSDSSHGRSRVATSKCKSRDNDVCIFSGTLDPEGAHIFPYAATNHDSQLIAMLRTFWGDQQAQQWMNLFQNKTFTESPRNMLSLSPTLHSWWDKAKYALKPLTRTDNEITVQFHWLRPSGLKPADRIMNDGKDLLSKAGLGQPNGSAAWGTRLCHRKSGLPIKTGQTFVITAKDPSDLPSFELLELQWDLLRVCAISGAADVDDEYYEESLNGDDDVVFYRLGRDEWLSEGDDLSP